MDKEAPLVKICLTPQGVERIQFFGPFEVQELAQDLYRCISDLIPVLDKRVKERYQAFAEGIDS